MVYAFGVGEVPISVSGPPNRPGPRRADGAGRRRGHECRSARARPARCSACAGRSATRGRSTTAPAATWSSSPEGSAWRRCGRRSCARSSDASDYGAVAAALRRTHARRPPLHATQLSEWRAGDRRRRDGRRRREAAGRAGSASCRSSSPAPAFDPDATAAFVCGPEIMMHFARRGARSSAGCRPSGSTCRWSGNMQCGVGHLRPLPARPDADLPGRAGLLRTQSSRRGWRCGSCERERQAQARRLEVRLLRRLPAVAARPRGRAARARRRGRDGRVPRSDEQRRRRAVRPLARRGLDHDRRTTPSGSRRSARASKALVTIGACATAGGIQALRNFADVGEFVAAVYASPEYISTLDDLDADRGSRPGRLRAARLPDQQAPAARGRDGVPARPQARNPVDERLHRVQARAGSSASPSRTGRPASGRSRMPAAARSAPRTTAAATAASGRWRRRTPQH